MQRKAKVGRHKSAVSMKTEIESELEIIISEQTVRRRLYEVRSESFVAREKSYMDKANRIQRIEYARNYPEKPLGFLDHVLWIDESKFSLFGSDRKVMVWRTPKETYDPKRTAPTVKHGGGSVKCWSCMFSLGVGNLVFIDGNMTGDSYRDLLQKNVFASVKNVSLGQERVMQHDNGLKY